MPGRIHEKIFEYFLEISLKITEEISTEYLGALSGVVPEGILEEIPS